MPRLKSRTTDKIDTKTGATKGAEKHRAGPNGRGCGEQAGKRGEQGSAAGEPTSKGQAAKAWQPKNAAAAGSGEQSSAPKAPNRHGAGKQGRQGEQGSAASKQAPTPATTTS